MEKILEDIRTLLKENILPRMDQMEAEITLLRNSTWPYCQANSEMNQLDNIEEKRKFLSVLSEHEKMELLILKSKYSGSPSLVKREYDLILNSKKNRQSCKF